MTFLDITFTGWMTLILTVSVAVLSGIMFIAGKERLHHIWGLFCAAMVVWTGAFYLVTLSHDPSVAKLWWKIAYIGIILIPFTFLHFTFEFIGFKKSRKRTIILLYSLALIFILAVFFSNLIINDVRFLFGEIYYITVGILHPYFMTIYSSLVVYAFYLLYKQYKESKEDKVAKKRILLFSVSAAIAFIGGTMDFLPTYGINSSPLFNLLVVAGSIMVSYTIFKHNLFNMKVILTEALVFVLWILIAIELFTAETTAQIVLSFFIFISVVVLGVLLMRSVSDEVKRREETEKLLEELKIANDKLKQLDKEKSDFISIASHQLRTPLTAIKGYTSMMMEGDYGKVTVKAKEVIQKVFDSSQRLVYLVNDLLDISRMEQGRLKYTFEDVKFAKLVKEVFDELSVNANKKKLKFTYHANEHAKETIINADYAKLRQAITNIIDNSIKYTDKGFVKVTVEKSEEGGTIVLSVKDSGIGMSQVTIRDLFEKFNRAEEAVKSHTEGTGLGLFVAKEIVKANGGIVWAESPGIGKGSEFLMRFPVKKA